MNPIAALSRAMSLKAFSPEQVLRYVPSGVRAHYPHNNWDPTSGINQGFKASAIVFSCMKLLMQAGSSVPWRVFRTNQDGTDELDRDQSEATVLEFPNDKITRKALIAFALVHLGLNGNALFKKVTVGGRVRELWPILPIGVAPVPDAEEWISGYEIMLPSGIKKWDVSEVIHAMLTDPMDPLWGMGLIQAAWPVITGDAQSQRWRSDILENGGVPPGAFKDPTLTSDEQAGEAADLLSRRWRDAARGGRPLILTAGTEWVPFAFNSRQMEELERRRLSIDEIRGVFGILPALFSETASKEVLSEAVRFMWEHGVSPLMDTLSESFTLALIPKKDWGKRWLHYDTSGVEALQKNIVPKSQVYATLVQHGISPDEARTIAGIPGKKIKGGDRSYINAALIPLEEVERRLEGEESWDVSGVAPKIDKRRLTSGDDS